MNQLNIVLAILLTFPGCSTVPEQNIDPALGLVNNSIKTHGGIESWLNAQRITYKKTTILYHESGSVESKTVQYHDYQLQPELMGTIEWVEDSSKHLIKYTQNLSEKYIDGVLQDSIENFKVKATFGAAHYVMMQPFKLLDAGIQLTYEGQDTLENNKIVEVVKAEYPGSESSKWFYYFDQETNRVVANMVDHGKGFSYIQNLTYDSTSTLVFNKHRKSYTVDSLRSIQYLRAEYFYDDIKLISEEY